MRTNTKEDVVTVSDSVESQESLETGGDRLSRNSDSGDRLSRSSDTGAGDRLSGDRLSRSSSKHEKFNRVRPQSGHESHETGARLYLDSGIHHDLHLSITVGHLLLCIYVVSSNDMTKQRGYNSKYRVANGCRIIQTSNANMTTLESKRGHLISPSLYFRYSLNRGHHLCQITHHLSRPGQCYCQV